MPPWSWFARTTISPELKGHVQAAATDAWHCKVHFEEHGREGQLVPFADRLPNLHRFADECNRLLTSIDCPEELISDAVKLIVDALPTTSWVELTETGYEASDCSYYWKGFYSQRTTTGPDTDALASPLIKVLRPRLQALIDERH